MTVQCCRFDPATPHRCRAGEKRAQVCQIKRKSDVGEAVIPGVIAWGRADALLRREGPQPERSASLRGQGERSSPGTRDPDFRLRDEQVEVEVGVQAEVGVQVV